MRRAVFAVTLVLIVSAPLVAWAGSRTYVRECEDSVYGNLGRDWRRNSVVAHRIAFVGARGYHDDPPRRFHKGENGYRTHKVLAVVENGRDVVVRVHRSDRRRAGLVYDPALFNRRLWIREADRTVRFDACKNKEENPFGKRRAQFNGGFVVARSRCVTLDILNRKRERIDRVTISFGAGRCR
jgi:hypothetical protein